MSVYATLDAPVFCSGATGYIGGAILRCLTDAGVPALGGVRQAQTLADGTPFFVTGDLAELGLKLPPVRAVIHAAGLGHKRGVGIEIWRRANIDAAVNLARAARAAGAQKFILVSTAHIHGRVYEGMMTDSTPPNPMDIYAESKLQAEHDVAAAFGLGLTIIRPVAVIGPGCPGNIQLLLKLLSRGIPLPFASIHNRRSFIDRDDLANIVLAALQSEKPPGSVLAAHPESIATPDVIRALAQGMGKPARLFGCPPNLLATGACLLGRSEMWQSSGRRFCGQPGGGPQPGLAPCAKP